MADLMSQVSTIICTRNPRLAYLRRTLDALHAQTLPMHLWELLLVDNASDQPLARSVDTSWHPNARHVVEPELGLAAARRRGISEAATKLLVFVDDDNLLDPSYLAEALRISREWVQLGVFGSGAIVPEFETPPKEQLNRFIHLLALRETGKDVWGNIILSPGTAPWGAGLCVRAEVARAYTEFSDKSSFKIIDRRGNSLISGQDVEIGYFSCSLGLGMGIFVNLRLTHLIPKERTEEGYLLRLVEGQELSSALLAYKWHGVEPKTPIPLREILSFAKTMLFREEIDRRVLLANLRARSEAKRIIANNLRRQK
jgi:glycosyltransferase involved in cell wall biosynthesis